LTTRNEAAFEALLLRHGPMILGVCRRMLPNTADAEDAFQAVFVVLLRKGTTIKQPHLLGNWLYGVAIHTARAALSAIHKRRAKEAQVTRKQSETTADDSIELAAILDEELAKLPLAFRDALLLCDLQGESRRDAAAKLKIAEGTLSSRLARGRTLLARRLEKRGVQAPLGAFTNGFGSVMNVAELPPALVDSTLRIGLHGLVMTAGATSMPALQLSDTVMRMMYLSKLKMLVPIAVLTIGLFAAAEVLAWRGARQTDSKVIGNSSTPDQQEKKAQANKTLVKQIVDALTSIEDANVRLDLLLKLGWTQWRLGERELALASAGKALEITKAIAIDSHKVSVLIDIAALQLKSGDRKTGLETFRQAVASALAIEEKNEKFNALLDVVRKQAALGEFDEAFRVAEEAVPSPEYALRNIAMYASFSYQRTKSPAALEALRKARDKAKTLGYSGFEALGVIARSFVRVGMPKEAMETVNAITMLDGPRGSRLHALQEMAWEQASTGDWRGALETIEKLGPSEHCYLLAAVANAQIEAGNRAAARSTVQKIQAFVANAERKGERAEPGQAAAAGKGPQGQRRAFRANPETKEKILARVGALEAKLGNIELGLETILAQPSNLDRVQSLMEIAEIQAKAGDKSGACKTLRKASRSVVWPPPVARDPMIRVMPPSPEYVEQVRSDSLQRVAIQQIGLGDAEGAAETLEDIKQDHYKNCSSVLVAKAEAGDWAGALAMLPKIKDQADRGYALESLTQKLTRGGKQDAALALTNQQTSSTWKAYALLGILAAGAPDLEQMK
jgi:RNA polymerase sigma factor (sigma-70 family)